METKDNNHIVHEKRVHARRLLRTQIVFEDEGGEGFIYFYSTDISEGGLFFESDVPLKLGTRIFLQFNLRETDAPLRVIGKVVRIEREIDDQTRVVGMGVQFVDCPSVIVQKIRGYVTGSK